MSGPVLSGSSAFVFEGWSDMSCLRKDMQGMCQIECCLVQKLWEQGLPAIGLDPVHCIARCPYRRQALLPQRRILSGSITLVRYAPNRGDFAQ